jgi:hypothetical protein
VTTLSGSWLKFVLITTVSSAYVVSPELTYALVAMLIVAYKRYTDNVPLAIDCDYLRAFERGIEKQLIEKLGLSSSEARYKAASFLQEAPDIMQQRDELNTRQERLENARRELLGLF